MPNNNLTALLQIRITPKLAENLKQVADQEANTASAVVRRLLSKGVLLELRRDDAQRSK